MIRQIKKFMQWHVDVKLTILYYIIRQSTKLAYQCDICRTKHFHIDNPVYHICEDCHYVFEKKLGVQFVTDDMIDSEQDIQLQIQRGLNEFYESEKMKHDYT